MLSTLCGSLNHLVMIWRAWLSFLALLSPPAAKLKVLFWGIEESVHRTPTPLKGEDASSKQSVEGPQAKAQPSMATLATEEDTCPKVLIRGEWCKVPDGYPKDASSQLERDQFINELAK